VIDAECDSVPAGTSTASQEAGPQPHWVASTSSDPEVEGALLTSLMDQNKKGREQDAGTGRYPLRSTFKWVEITAASSSRDGIREPDKQHSVKDSKWLGKRKRKGTVQKSSDPAEITPERFLQQVGQDHSVLSRLGF
jgi:hypothetical protein